MNKKFLSAILFGALMAGTAGTFTSCKDYDDDIDQINKELTDIKSQIAALQSAVNNGKWITSVTPSADGLVITMNDGQTFNITNGKDGAPGTNGTDGAAGAAGTEWTISEDGFWVCNGEKTDVKAVGQDGEKGEAGQQEVKFEDGKWFLWNGTEFVEFKGAAATAENVPYYYTDPNDQNYAVLVVFDKDGQNKKEIRLPMNSGLAQITILDATGAAQGADIQVGYGLRKASTEWDGNKELPAEGEYLVGVNTNSILVQVTPANYDLAALDLKFVNGKGEEVPVTVGKATPATLTKAVSATGVYKIDVTVDPIKGDAELAEFYKNGQPISLMANESVRSTYTSKLTMTKPTSSIYKDFFENETIEAEPGVDYTVGPDVDRDADGNVTKDNSKDVCFIYDSYLTVEGSESNKAAALRNGIEIDGMTVKSSKNASGEVKFVAHYIDVLGKVYEQKKTDSTEDITINFAGAQAPTEDVDLAAVEHTVQFADKPSQLVSLDEYFKGMSEDERILWNDTYQLVLEKVAYSYVDDINAERTGKLNDLIAISNNEGKNLNTAGELKKLKNLKFTFDYTKAFHMISDTEKQDMFKYDVNYVATVAVKKANGEKVQTITIPFTIKNPSAEAIATQYTFNANAYDAAKNAFVVKGEQATLSNLITMVWNAEADPTVDFSGAGQPTYSAEYTVANTGIVTKGTLKDDGTVNNAGKYNKPYPVTGIKITYAGHKFAIPTVNVIFQESAENTYTFGLSKALTINKGGNAVDVNIGDWDPKTETHDAALNLYDAAGNKLKLDVVTITSVEIVTNVGLVKLEPVEGGISKGFTLKANNNPEVDTPVHAIVKFKLAGDSTEKVTYANVIVTVKAL